ncbi:hypothetical protein HNR46_001119 [Haloferula luteola]|uniref:Uncharacterized protein n=1 Tax=Haloferula luteola TaxID=595692 RepID=A0A840UYS2_9BACT|nr:hypothetical protein [Haloferula luteola]MBB5350885.1 hypothetical protein [Haloferula luteola]
MSHAHFICPDTREGLADHTGGLPLVLGLYLGKPFLDHALHGCSVAGVKSVTLYASDRPAELRDYLSGGSAWGLDVQVVATPHELSIAEARSRYDIPTEASIEPLDHLPQRPDVPILTGPADWHASRAELLPILAPGQVGAREIAPGIWAGMKTRISPTAVLVAPCWIGHQAAIGEHAHLGPRAFVENDALVEAHAEIADSTLGSRTYLGSLTHLSRSVATGSSLTNWSNGSQVRLTDAFLLSHLDPPREAASRLTWRMLALGMLVLTLPLPLFALLLAPIRRRPFWRSRLAVLPSAPGEGLRSISFGDLPALPGTWSRWPQLWRIVTGHFAWTGNPPLDPEQACLLQSEFERLWLHLPPGVFTAPEAEGCSAPWDDEARAHAALFASHPTFAWRRRILSRGLRSLVSRNRPSPDPCTPKPPVTPSVSPASPN